MSVLMPRCWCAGCDYYDYGVNIEGTGSMGILENILLDQVRECWAVG